VIENVRLKRSRADGDLGNTRIENRGRIEGEAKEPYLREEFVSGGFLVVSAATAVEEPKSDLSGAQELYDFLAPLFELLGCDKFEQPQNPRPVVRESSDVGL